LDQDDDGDGIPTRDESSGVTDSDGDEMPDSMDADSDNDGVADAIEGHDTNRDGRPDRVPSGRDADQDGLDDSFDGDPGGAAIPYPDHDSDDHLDFQDSDDDGDGIDTSDEVGGNPLADKDGDGIPDYLDLANANPCVPNRNNPVCNSFGNQGKALYLPGIHARSEN
jgi:hypothetical protein